MKRHEALSVGQIIEKAMAATGNSDMLNKQKVSFLWQEVVGPAINRYTVRRYVDGHTLHVYLSSASLKNELSFRKEALVNSINRLLGETYLEEILFH